MPYVEERLFHFCHTCNVGNYYSVVAVATIQAVQNAIVHGNGSDVDKSVSIGLGTCSGGIYVEVADQGEGFDFSRFGGLPSMDETAGEGIFVMHQLADRVDYSDGGRRVRMEFEVAGIDPADALHRVAVLESAFATVAA